MNTALPEKTCARCGRRFSWRKKWERDWEQVRYCSTACRRRKLNHEDQALEERILRALDHEEGHGMADGPMPTADERLRQTKPGKGGIFVVDQYGAMHMAQKVPGALHHSSFTGGHCCRFAGSIAVDDGRASVRTSGVHGVYHPIDHRILVSSLRLALLTLALL